MSTWTDLWKQRCHNCGGALFGHVLFCGNCPEGPTNTAAYSVLAICINAEREEFRPIAILQSRQQAFDHARLVAGGGIIQNPIIAANATRTFAAGDMAVIKWEHEGAAGIATPLEAWGGIQ